ncbi:MAG: PASTA domain-containing protein [Oscillospiraceae bacterium]
MTENLCMGCMREIGDAKQCPHCGFFVDSPQIAPFLPLKAIISGRYSVGKMLSSSGDGATYIGWDIEKNTPITIREFLPENMINREIFSSAVTAKEGSELVFYDGLQEFLNLWRKLARMREFPAIVPVIDIFEENGTAYAISEYVEFITLREFLLKSRAGYISWEQIRILVMPLISTINALHSVGVFHCGISPNTLVIGRDGKLRITGFQITEARVQNTGYNSEIFAGYAAIEQYGFDGEIGKMTDVYGFSAVIFRALTGSTPIEATERVVNDKMIVPAKIAETLPSYLIDALQSGLDMSQADRIQDVDLLREALSGSPSSMEAKKQVQMAQPIDEEKERQKRNEKDLKDQAAKEAQTKILLIAFGSCLLVGVVVLVGFFALEKIKSDKQAETTTTEVAKELVNVPDFKGQSYSRISGDAVQNERFKFVIEYAFSKDIETGFIISQGTAEGQRIPKGSELKLVVSKGIENVLLPDITGWDYEEAAKTLTELGFVCKKIEKTNDGTKVEGAVFDITPVPKVEYPKGKEIILQVWGAVPTTEATTEEAKTTTNIFNGIADILGR